jgi:hypothetical protein
MLEDEVVVTSKLRGPLFHHSTAFSSLRLHISTREYKKLETPPTNLFSHSICVYRTYFNCTKSHYIDTTTSAKYTSTTQNVRRIQKRRP